MDNSNPSFLSVLIDIVKGIIPSIVIFIITNLFLLNRKSVRIDKANEELLKYTINNEKNLSDDQLVIIYNTMIRYICKKYRVRPNNIIDLDYITTMHSLLHSERRFVPCFEDDTDLSEEQRCEDLSKQCREVLYKREYGRKLYAAYDDLNDDLIDDLDFNILNAKAAKRRILFRYLIFAIVTILICLLFYFIYRYILYNIISLYTYVSLLISSILLIFLSFYWSNHKHIK